MSEKKPIKLVAVDLDGTLLDHNTRVPERTVAAIARARQCGADVLLATGKTLESAVPVMAQLNRQLPGVYHQGHLIYAADGRLLREKAMDPDLAQAVFDYVQARGLPLVAYDRDGLWATAPGPHRDHLHYKYAEPLPWLTRVIPDVTGVQKYLIGVNGDAATLRAELEGRFGRYLRVLQAVPESVEMMSLDVSKGEGVAWMLDYLGVDPQEVMAIGDGENDIEMLQLAGTAVAMGNAAPSLKAVADHIVGSNEQAGVAEALERFVLAGCPAAG